MSLLEEKGTPKPKEKPLEQGEDQHNVKTACLQSVSLVPLSK